MLREKQIMVLLILLIIWSKGLLGLNTICDKPENIDIKATNTNSCESKTVFQGKNLTRIHDRDKLPYEVWGLDTRKDQISHAKMK